ncbi:gp436 family protein [Methylobrevis pamukkalensis]|uniref:Mu-like prophage protein gp36 n=1 Tax=Methylobrevis pamukkalensis TaxID=1439726 RepID=A0A1E3H4C6_9HYPH|nr:DUF1320 domain-containing protein [Methylobrevis pamukkalensis]ODN71178.1 hypothetical protein A6302_01467 [Methylobrevis pamukkalensis]
MPYCTLADLIERAGETEILEVADRDLDGIADADAVAAAIGQADQTIDGYLGTRFALPLTTVPGLVGKWSVSIARYLLHRDGAPDHVVRDYRDAVAELRDAGAGRLALPDLSGLAPASSSSGSGLAEGTRPVFDRCGLKGWL